MHLLGQPNIFLAYSTKGKKAELLERLAGGGAASDAAEGGRAARGGPAGAQSVGEVGARMDVHDVSLDSDDLDDDPLADKPPPKKATVAELQKQLAARGLK